MHLLNTRTLRLETFSAKVPRYAILSHTWGDEELLFGDMTPALNPTPGLISSSKKGLEKVLKTCEQARLDGFDYVWVDTCCIDKSSSAELSESINSMFRWYSNSTVCYAFLADVTWYTESNESTLAEFRASRWFTRGWTLQELIAPTNLVFYDRAWIEFGTRSVFAEEIERITSIDSILLDRTNSRDSLTTLLSECSIYNRMTWAAKRHTTRVEDMAYSLLGIFGVSLPLLYGEGDKAFVRLQEEILKSTSDQSFLLFNRTSFSGLLGHHPSQFAMPIKIEKNRSSMRHRIQSTRNRVIRTPAGIELTVDLYLCTGDWLNKAMPVWVAILDCDIRNEFLARPGILLSKTSEENTFYTSLESPVALRYPETDRMFAIRSSFGERVGTSQWHVPTNQSSSFGRGPYRIMTEFLNSRILLVNSSTDMPSGVVAPNILVQLRSKVVGCMRMHLRHSHPVTYEGSFCSLTNTARYHTPSAPAASYVHMVTGGFHVRFGITPLFASFPIFRVLYRVRNEFYFSMMADVSIPNTEVCQVSATSDSQYDESSQFGEIRSQRTFPQSGIAAGVWASCGMTGSTSSITFEGILVTASIERVEFQSMVGFKIEVVAESVREEIDER